MALYWGFRIAAFLARVVPLRASYAFARAGGLAAYYLWPGGRRRCARNMLRPAGGDEALARNLARRSFSYYGLYLVDFFRFSSLSREELGGGASSSTSGSSWTRRATGTACSS